MQDLIPFSIKIQNLVSFLETLQNSNIHLCNPTLCSEMVSKLPVSKQDQWLRYALSIRPYFTLKDLSSWLTLEAQYIRLFKFDSDSSNNNKRRLMLVSENEPKDTCPCC